MITRSERSGEKRNRIFSPGRRNRREKKLPFRLSFITKGDGGRVYPFTRFVNGEEAVLEESAGVSLVENQDIWLRFDGPPDFRFTMDGLDVVTLPHAEKIDGQSYLRPGWKGEPFLLFEGRDFPLVPGYYVITVTGAGKIWRGLLEITPKFMGRQSWQAMREELVEEIKDLSFDFMKRSIHISRSMEGELGLKSAMLLRFYAISEESDRVVQVLGELARTANSRIVRKQGVVRSNRDAAGAHIRCASGKSREGTPVLPVICSEVTWNVAENRFAKAILQKLDENLRSFVQEIDDHARWLGKVQDANAGYYKNRDFKNGANALSHFEKYRARAVHIRNAIRMVAEATWFHEAESGMPETLPMTVFLDPRYSLLYRLYRNLKNPADSLSVSSFYQFQWKRTDKLYELWCFLQFIKALEEKGWDLATGPAVVQEDGKYRLSSLEEGTEITLSRNDEKIRLIYDGTVPQHASDTDRETDPLYTNNVHRRPDLRMDYYRNGAYYGSLVADFKYRDIFFLWRDAARSAGIRTQFNAYRDMNTKFYRGMEESDSIRNSRPVKEVWAVFPKEIPPRGDEDFSLRFISLAPGLKANGNLAEMVERYIVSLNEN